MDNMEIDGIYVTSKMARSRAFDAFPRFLYSRYFFDPRTGIDLFSVKRSNSDSHFYVEFGFGSFGVFAETGLRICCGFSQTELLDGEAFFSNLYSGLGGTKEFLSRDPSTWAIRDSVEIHVSCKSRR